MFDWVLNRPLVLADNHFISLILKLLKGRKSSFTGVSDMNWLTNKKVTKILSLIYFISCLSNRNLLY